MSHNFCHLWARTDPLQVHLQVPLLGTRHLPVQVTPGPQSPIHLNGTEEISEGLQRATDYPQGQWWTRQRKRGRGHPFSWHLCWMEAAPSLLSSRIYPKSVQLSNPHQGSSNHFPKALYLSSTRVSFRVECHGDCSPLPVC